MGRFFNALRGLVAALRFGNEIGAVGNWPKGMVEDRYEWLMDGYGEAETKISSIFEEKTKTDGMYDQRTSVIGMGKLAQKSEVDSTITYRRPSEAFTAYASLNQFDDGITLTMNEVDRMPAEKVKDLMKQTVSSWGRALRTTEEDFAATVFTKGGFTSGHDNFKNVVGSGSILSQNTDGLAYDAKPLFNRSDNTRTSKGGGTYYNGLASLPLNVTNYATLHDLMFVTNAYDERDERVDLKSMGKFALIFPPQLRDEAVRTVESEYLPGTDQNDKNPWFKSCGLVEWDALRDNAGTWYGQILKQGLRFYRGGKPEIRPWRDESDRSYNASIVGLYGFMAWNFRFSAAAGTPTS